jgi:hypothetical protein
LHIFELKLRTRFAARLELPVTAWLIAYGRIAGGIDPTPASQNHVLVGLLLAMLAIVPSMCLEPPQAWRARS